MARFPILALAFCFVSPALAGTRDRADDRVVTATGWFSDRSCAAPRVAKGDLTPNNPDCVKTCLDKGVPPVFVSEQAKALFDVKDHAAVKDDVGYHVEVTGVIDPEGRTIAIRSVKRLEYMGALCALPKKPKP